MKVSAIVAMSQNRVIGKDGKLPWHLPQDLKRFRELTMGHPILMGRKTFESLPRVLPGRLHLVISRRPAEILNPSGESAVKVVSSLEEGLEICRARQEKDPFIIGGAQIYALALPWIDRLYLTEIHQEIEGDTIFPADWNQFTEVRRETFSEPFPFSFVLLDKKSGSF